MRVRQTSFASVGISAAVLLQSHAAIAAEASPAPASSDMAIETITVTAQRRSEDVEKVPIAISAVSGAALSAAGVTNVQELGNTVPGLNIENNVGNAFVFIRGVGTTALAVENDVGVYIDGVYITSQSASLMNLSNIDHVEVLKGPQGTLFGRNAIGGALSVVTKDPSSKPVADVELGYASFKTTTANIYGSTGIAPGLATDLAFYYSDQGSGWGHNLTNSTPNFRARTIQARNKWVYEPVDDTKITLSLDYALIHNQAGAEWSFLPGAFGADGVSTNRGFYNSLGNGLSNNESQTWGTMLRVDQNLHWARAVSITSLRAATNHNNIDQDATPLPIVEASPTPQNDRSYSEELQLLSRDESAIQWIVGAYALYDKYYTPNFNIYVLNSAPPPPITHELLVVNEPTKSYAAFGQATLPIAPNTHLTVGLRFTDDHKSVDGKVYLNGDLLPPVIPGLTNPSYQSTTFTKFTYRGVLDYEFTPDMMAYLSYDTGFKSGQYNLISFAEPPVQPETLDAYQAGIKSSFLDRRLQVNLAGFYYKYQNIQITQDVTGGTQLLNAAAARLYGADADFTFVVTPQFKVQGSAEWLHGYYSKFPDAPSYVPNLSPAGVPLGANALVGIDATNKTTVHSPKITAYVAGNYEVPFQSGGLNFNANLSYNSGYFWDPDNRLRQPAYALLGAYVKWSAAQNWDVRVWGNNLTNREYYAFESAFALGDVAAAAAPRTYGITAGYHFR